MRKENQEQFGGMPGLKKSRIELRYSPGGYRDAADAESALSEEAKRELLTKVNELALRVENLVQLSPEQEIHWRVSLAPPMSEAEEKQELKRISYDLVRGKPGDVEENLSLYRVDLPDKDLNELRDLEKKYMATWDPKLREQLDLKFSQTVLPYKRPDFRHASLHLKVQVLAKAARGETEFVSYFDNIMLYQGDKAVHYKGSTADSNIDQAAQSIANWLNGIRPER